MENYDEMIDEFIVGVRKYYSTRPSVLGYDISTVEWEEKTRNKWRNHISELQEWINFLRKENATEAQ